MSAVDSDDRSTVISLGGWSRSALAILFGVLLGLGVAVGATAPTASAAAFVTASSASAYTYDVPRSSSSQHASPVGETNAVQRAGGLARENSVVVSDFGVAAKTVDNIVLGHYPEYVDVAKATGARTFQVPTKIWDSMPSAEQWTANQKFLDRAITRGSNVHLATPANAAREGSFFERELLYMQSQRYKVADDGMSLLAPGRR